MQTRPALVAAVGFAAVVGVVSALAAWIPFPNYGKWTGIAPLEAKIGLLDRFARHGDVDALVIGSSLVDMGFNAELFSELMSKENGSPFRAFNFATGGAELRMLPKLYRLARIVCQPKTVYVMHPLEPKLSEQLAEQGPDRALLDAPAGRLLYRPTRLALDYLTHDWPLPRSAPGIRDLLMHGDFRNHRAVEAFGVDDYGDHLSFQMTRKPGDLATHRQQSETWVSLFPLGSVSAADAGQGADGQRTANQRIADQRKAEFYFARIDIDALHELRGLVDEDGGSIVVVAHGAASTYLGGPPANAQYDAVRHDYFATLAQIAGARLVDPAERISVSIEEVADVTHLNAYGAAVYTRAAFAAMTNKPRELVESGMRAPSPLFATADPSYNLFSTLVRRPPGEAHSALQFRLVPIVGTGRLPPLERLRAFLGLTPADVTIELRTPDNVDIIAVAHGLPGGELRAEIELPAANRAEGYVLRLVSGRPPDAIAYLRPIASYRWVRARG